MPKQAAPALRFLKGGLHGRVLGCLPAQFPTVKGFEREQRGISLDDVALSTKIGARFLRAMEEEKFDQLPGGIFNRGFVRAYARRVGIDEEQAVADYLEATGETIPTGQPEPSIPVPHPVPPDNKTKD